VSQDVIAAPTVAIDGPSGSGKSTVARELARRHGWRWVDTGAMYRALTWWVLDQGIDPADTAAVAAAADRLPLVLGTDPDRPRVEVGGQDITEAIRSDSVTAAVSTVSAIPAVRAAFVARQRHLAGAGGVVMEGRDIGTTVLPGATLKIFLTAGAEQRAARRAREHGGDTRAVAAAIGVRDRLDSSRAASPLRRAADAVLIDSSHLGVADVVGQAEARLARECSVLAEVTTGEGRVLRAVRRVARLVVHAVLRVRLVGVERIPSGAVLLAGNHTGFLDGPLVYVVLDRPAMFLAKAELFSGIWARVLRAVRQVPVARGTPDRHALRSAVTMLKAGGVVAMFPEGTRGEGKLETIQDGVGYIAARTGCPVVPVVCRGTAEALPKGKFLPKWRTPVEVVFGEPFTVISSTPLRRADIRRAAEQIADELRSLVVRTGPS
jgi:cytidylate kinase